MIVGQSNYCPACGSSDSSLGVNPFLDKKIITDGRKNHLCQTFREMLEERSTRSRRWKRRERRRRERRREERRGASVYGGSIVERMSSSYSI